MKPSLLTQLGCLGSLAVALSLGSAAQAENIPNSIQIFPEQSSQPTTLTSKQNNPEQQAIISNNDSIA